MWELQKFGLPHNIMKDLNTMFKRDNDGTNAMKTFDDELPTNLEVAMDTAAEYTGISIRNQFAPSPGEIQKTTRAIRRERCVKIYARDFFFINYTNIYVDSALTNNAEECLPTLLKIHRGLIKWTIGNVCICISCDQQMTHFFSIAIAKYSELYPQLNQIVYFQAFWHGFMLHNSDVLNDFIKELMQSFSVVSGAVPKTHDCKDIWQTLDNDIMVGFEFSIRNLWFKYFLECKPAASQLLAAYKNDISRLHDGNYDAETILSREMNFEKKIGKLFLNFIDKIDAIEWTNFYEIVSMYFTGTDGVRVNEKEFRAKCGRCFDFLFPMGNRHNYIAQGLQKEAMRTLLKIRGDDIALDQLFGLQVFVNSSRLGHSSATDEFFEREGIKSAKCLARSMHTSRSFATMSEIFCDQTRRKGSKVSFIRSLAFSVPAATNNGDICS